MSAPRYIKKMVKIDEAIRVTVNSVKPVGDVLELPVLKAIGMVVAEDVRAPYDFPPRPRAAYDGYAVRSEDTPGKLKVIGEAVIGSTASGLRVEPGTAVYVSTGAYLPEGADAVVPEEIGVKDGYIVVNRKVKKWENVDPVGFYVRRNSVLLPKGYVVTMMDAVALLDVAVTRLKVYRKVRMAIVVTGNELFEPSGSGDEDRILAGEVAETTGKLVEWFISRYAPWVEVVKRLLMPDDVEAISWYVGRQLTNVDVVVMTGGTGPSTVDTFHQLVDRLGGRLLFRGLFVRGGRPTSAMVLRDGRLFVALSGHPVSALHAAIRYLYPVLKHLGNVVRAPEPPIVYYAVLEEDYESKRPEPLKVKLCMRDGVLYARPLKRERQLSSVIASNVEADGLALSEGRMHKAGEKLPVLVYREPSVC